VRKGGWWEEGRGGERGWKRVHKSREGRGERGQERKER
jgi:hypothetical protein